MSGCEANRRSFHDLDRPHHPRCLRRRLRRDHRVHALLGTLPMKEVIRILAVLVIIWIAETIFAIVNFIRGRKV